MVNSQGILISYYEDAKKHLAAVQDADPVTFQNALNTCKELRNQIEAQMTQSYCDPRANNRVTYIKVS